MSGRTPGSVKWGAVLGVGAFGTIVIIVCVSLGWWQWSAGTHAQAPPPDLTPVPIAEALEPASPAEGSVGTAVEAPGQWADAEAALVSGRTIEDEEAVLVVRPFTVSADATGTGEPGTLAVVVGWLPAGDITEVSQAPSVTTDVVGYLRGSEGLAGIGETPQTHVPGAFWVPTLSPAIFAQHWDSPLYSAVLVNHAPEEGLNAMPEPEPETSLNFRSITYALEWWLFGAFFAFIAARWIRDNGRVPRDPIDEDMEAPNPAL
ncbi:SURF1 family cytochrome oxidase biogenesis protein [Demequina flava]|uniref:SURF1 family cytochrome oxidase biogenesis protein n=1 Tax=Demequina flava TaxID=1095025 RepID=UPI0007857BE2|nr:SURF1 family cytochrome oxidase biogenesis protein [Demequina flava]